MRNAARIALALSLFVAAACGGDDDEAAPTTTTTEATTTSVEETTTTEAAPQGTTLVARSEVDVIPVYADETGGEPEMELDRRTETTGNLVFVVEQEASAPDGRHLVQLPVRPNGSTGWVDASDVSLTVHDYRIEIELAAYELRVFKGGDELLSTPIGVGPRCTRWPPSPSTCPPPRSAGAHGSAAPP